MEYGLIAEHLGHSFSKTIHQQIDDYDYTMQEVSKESLDAFMKNRAFRGINVTIPYKEKVIPYLDEISPIAERIGAVNTIVNRNGKLCGYNTDFGGMIALIQKMGVDLCNKKVLILGSGGTGKTAGAVARYFAAAQIIVVSRSQKPGAITYEEMYRSFTDAQIIINTTPCGMFPNGDAMPIDLAAFDRLEGVVDVIFNPLRTNLVNAAREKGIPAEGGLYMLVAQAVLAAEIFQDKTYDRALADRIYHTLLAEKENIVLIGMPSSGKTTVGRLLEQKLGKAFVDIDDLIVAHSAKAITEIFAQYGEAYFRQLERDEVHDLCAKNGLVIATGGGCVLKEENIRMLKRNGRVFFLQRPLEALLPTADRPTADSKEKMAQLYAERLPIYTKAADHIIASAHSAEEAAQKIIAAYTWEGKR